MLKKLIPVSLLLFCHQLIWAQETKSFENQTEIKKACQVIVDHFTNDAISEAFLSLREIWILPEDELDYLESKSISQFNIIGLRYGGVIDNILVKENLVENLLYRLTYVVKYEKHGIRLTFTFYNGKEGKWYLNGFKWGDSITELINDE